MSFSIDTHSLSPAPPAEPSPGQLACLRRKLAERDGEIDALREAADRLVATNSRLAREVAVLRDEVRRLLAVGKF